VAFTTKAGNPTSITGTDKVDVLSSVDLAGNFIVKADKEADIISLVSTVEPSQLTDVSVYGQDGIDTITAPSAALFRGRTQGGEGNDNINYGNLNTYQTYGGADNDTINFTLGINSTIQGSKGNDTIGGLGNVNVSTSKVYGGAGNDQIFAGAITSSIIQGSAGNDFLSLNGVISGKSKVNGGSENDSIDIFGTTNVAAKGSTINGNKGGDRIRVAQGAVLDNITIFGGSGSDNIAAFDQETTITGDKGEDTLGTGVADEVSVSGGDGIDRIAVTTGNNLLINTDFTGASNVVAAAAGNDSSVNGGAGNDIITMTAAVGDTLVSQARTESTAATTATGLTGGKVVANADSIVFANGLDVVTGFDTAAAGTVTDQLGLELTTTAANLALAGLAGGDILNGSAAGAAVTYGDVIASGQTTLLIGTVAGNTFTIDDTAAGAAIDVLVIQGDGSALTANTSAFVINNAGAFNFANFGVTNVTGFGTFSA
jgi:hypothetical protein